MCSIDDTEQYDSALASCEETAGNHGHALGGVWYPVDERLRASICVLCGAMVCVTRPGKEKRWRIGGTALKEDCSGGTLRRGLGDATRAIVHKGCSGSESTV
jgi:hypothetical protein